MRKRRTSGGQISFNMTPMIDVVLLLIIFFLLTSKLQGEETELLSLPFATQAEPAHQQEKAPQFVINIKPEFNGPNDDPTGRAFYVYQGMLIDPENAVEMNELSGKLRQFRVEYEDAGRVIIRADRRIHTKYVSRILAECASRNITNVQYGSSAQQYREE